MVESPQTAVADVFIPTPYVLESTPDQTRANGVGELFLNDQLGLCFSYPQGYTQIPYNGAVKIAAPDLPGSDVKGLFWLEISDSYNRTTEEIADQDMTHFRQQLITKAHVSQRTQAKSSETEYCLQN